MYKFLIGLFFIVAVVGPFAVLSPASARAAGLTEVQIQAILSLLASFGADASVITNVNSTLHGQVSGESPAPIGSACLSLSRNLYPDTTDAVTGGDVSRLQQFLGGRVTGYFGPATLRLVQNWQASHGLVSSGSPETTGYGAVGSQTRAAMSRNCAGAALTALPATGAAPLYVEFSLTGAVAGELQLDFGDGVIQNTDTLCLAGGACNDPYVRSHTYTSAGTYTVRALRSGYSLATTQISVTSATGAQPSLLVASVYGSTVSVRYANMPAAAGIHVRSVYGGTVWTQQLGSGSGTALIALPASVQAGTYVLDAFGSDGSVYATSASFVLGVNSAL